MAVIPRLISIIPTWKLMRNCHMAASHLLLSTHVTPIKTSQTNSKLSQKTIENSQNYPKTYFSMAMFSGLIHSWKLMRNCHMVVSHRL